MGLRRKREKNSLGRQIYQFTSKTVRQLFILLKNKSILELSYDITYPKLKYGTIIKYCLSNLEMDDYKSAKVTCIKLILFFHSCGFALPLILTSKCKRESTHPLYSTRKCNLLLKRVCNGKRMWQYNESQTQMLNRLWIVAAAP